MVWLRRSMRHTLNLFKRPFVWTNALTLWFFSEVLAKVHTARILGFSPEPQFQKWCLNFCIFCPLIMVRISKFIKSDSFLFNYFILNFSLSCIFLLAKVTSSLLCLEIFLAKLTSSSLTILLSSDIRTQFCYVLCHHIHEEVGILESHPMSATSPKLFPVSYNHILFFLSHLLLKHNSFV